MTAHPATSTAPVNPPGILQKHATAAVLFFTLIAASLAVFQNLLVYGLQAIFIEPDSQWYLKMANGDIAGTAQPFAWRQLAPLVCRAFMRIFSIDEQKAYLLEAVLSLVALLAIIAILLLRRAPNLFFFASIAGLALWASLFYYFMLPDLLNAALLACLLLLLDRRRYLPAALMLFPLFISRESTSLVFACLLAAGTGVFKRRHYVVAVVAASAGYFTVRQMASSSLPNREQVDMLVYLAGKTIWNLSRNIGFPLWNNLNTVYCEAPHGLTAVHIGGMTAMGFCGFHPEFLVYTSRMALGLFGLLPILLVFLWRQDGISWKDESPLLRFCLLYGAASFLIAPLIGIAFSRPFAYAWPLFAVYLPSVAMRSFTLRRAPAILFLVSHLAVTWANEMFLNRSSLAVELALLCLYLCAYFCGWVLLRNHTEAASCERCDSAPAATGDSLPGRLAVHANRPENRETTAGESRKYARARVVAILLIAVTAVALVASNGSFTLIHDETWLIATACPPALSILNTFLTGNTQHSHPPLSEIVLHMWLAATNYSFILLRVFANIFYLAGVVFLALAAKLAGGQRAYWAALLIGIVWPFSFQYGREAGWPSFCWFLIALLTWLYLKILNGGRSASWTAFGFVGICLIWSNYFGLAILLVLLADLLLVHRELAVRSIRFLLFVIAAVAVSSLPLLRAALHSEAIQTAATAIPHSHLMAIVAVVGYPVFSIFASNAVAPWYLPLSIPAVLAVVLLLVSIWRSAGRRWLVYWIAAMALLALSGYFEIQRMLILLPWFFLAVAIAAAEEGSRAAKPVLAACMVLIVVGWAGIVSGQHYSTTNLYEPWDKVARTVAADAKNGATIISDNDTFFFYLDYRLGLEKETSATTVTYLGEDFYRLHGYRVLLSADLPRSTDNLHGRIVLVEGSSDVNGVRKIQGLEGDLRNRCRLQGQYQAAPDPAFAIKAKYIEKVPALTFRTVVLWYDCP